MRFRLVRKSVTVNDLEWRNSPYRVHCVISPNSVAFGQGHREFPFGNSREFPGIADPKIPGGNSREFLIFWRELRGISRVLSFFPIFIVDYDILVFNFTAF